MAIIYSYPLNDDIKPLDELVGTTEQSINGQLKTVTRNFLLQDLAEFFIVDGGLQKTITLTTSGTSGAATLNQLTGVLNIPQYSGGGGSQNLQQVTEVGNITNKQILMPLLQLSGESLQAREALSVTNSDFDTLTGDYVGIGIKGVGEQGIVGVSSSSYGAGVTGISGSDGAGVLGIGNAYGIVASSSFGTGLITTSTEYYGLIASSSTGVAASFSTTAASNENNIVEFFKNGSLVANITYEGKVVSNGFVKIGGLSTQYLMADGSVTTGSPSGGGSIPHATASGTDTYTATITGVASYSDGDAFLIRFPNGNTTSATLNINSLGARGLYRNNDGPLIGGDITSGGEMLCIYNTTLSGFQCIGTSPNSLFSYVKNDDSVTITKGMPVYAFSGTGDRMTVKRAKNTGDATSAQTVGLVLSTSIAAGQKGIIMMQGLLDGLSILPTSTWTDGDPVYLGDTDGSITNIKPYAPNHLVYLGVVTTASNGSAGRMYVRVQNGYELDELHNVQARTPSLKDTLWYDNTVSPAQWKTSSISTILGYTPANDSNVVHKTGDETIAGVKLFTGGIEISLSGNALKVSSGQATALDVIGGNNSNPIAKFTRVTDSVEVVRVDNSGLKLQLETASTIASFDANKNIVSLPTATYPSLVELTYVKGITSAIQTQLNGKQPINANLTSISALSTTSATSFVKVFNGAYFLDTSVGTQSAFTMLANNSSSSAAPTEQPFESVAQKAYTGTIVITATTSPSGTTNHSYAFTQVGKLVNLRINLDYANTGTLVSAIACELPSDCPTPEIPTAAGSTGDVIVYGTGTMSASRSIVGAMGIMALRTKSSGVYELAVTRTGASFNKAYYSVQYLTT